MDNVIEHIPPDTLNDVLKKCLTLLNDVGFLIIFTPHKFTGPHDISKKYLPLGSKADGLHLREFSFSELNENFKKVGFEDVLAFLFHPRLLKNFNIIASPSTWAARKAIFFEKIIDRKSLSWILRLNRVCTSAMVAILFPAVCIGCKGLKTYKYNSSQPLK